jgi:hypothetical protein
MYLIPNASCQTKSVVNDMIKCEEKRKEGDRG